MKTKLSLALRAWHFAPGLMLLSILNSPLSTALAQGMAFTYEGQLQDNGNPASGAYNLTFAPFNTSSGGSALTAAVTNNNVVVTNGLFTVPIDFGPGVFTGQSIWLEIGVESNGVSSFTTLAPRQQLTPAPYAIYAESAGNLSGTVSAAQLTSIGNDSGGNDNFFVGPSGNSTTSGTGNTTLGGDALINNTTGFDNTAIGSGALYNNADGIANTVVGAGALYRNTSGFADTANGTEALNANTTGSDNTAIGFQALLYNTTGSSNIAVGVNAGNAITTGDNNIDIGNTGFGNESDTIRIGTTQTKAVMLGIYPTTITSSAGLVCVNSSGLLGTGSAGGAFLASDLQIGTGAGDYHHLTLGGGNSEGFLFGAYNYYLQDWINLSYNFYADAGGTGHVINSGGGTSRIAVGYSEIVLAVGGVNTAPATVRLDATTTGVSVYGTFNNLSDRNAKQGFAPVSPSKILDEVTQLPLSEWSYKEDPSTRHVGPVAQDFYAAFNIGTDDKHIAPVDEGGVALAAIQGLNQKLEQKETEITELNQKNQSLEKRLEAVEQIIRHQSSN